MTNIEEKRLKRIRKEALRQKNPFLITTKGIVKLTLPKISKSRKSRKVKLGNKTVKIGR